MKILYFLLTALCLSFGNSSSSPTQEKEYTVRATVQEFQIILSNQDDVPKSQRDRVIAKFAAQLNKQIMDTTKSK